MPPNNLSFSLSNQEVDHHDSEFMFINSELKKPKHWYEFETEIKWRNVVTTVALHCAFVYSALTFPYREHLFLVLWGWMMGFVGTFGITCFAHRYWTHRTFKATVPLQILGAILFYCNGMSPIYHWVRDHRLHHKYSDTEADPHDITRGFFFSHVGWLVLKKRSIVIQRGKGIDMSDILEDPVAQFFDRYYVILMPFFSFVLPVLLPVYFFNQDLKMTMISQLFIRYPYVLNVVRSINSASHMFGTQLYDESIKATDNLWLSLLTTGEGSHNFHHAFPWDYRTAPHTNFVTNLSGFMLDIQGKIGWAYDFKTVSDDQIKKYMKRKAEENRLNDKLK